MVRRRDKEEVMEVVALYLNLMTVRAAFTVPPSGDTDDLL